MAKLLGLKIGGRDVTLERSTTEIAVRPVPGMRSAFDSHLGELAVRRSTTRRGTVGRFEIVSIKAPEKIVARERGFLAQRAAVGDVTPVYYTSADRVPFVPPGTIYLLFDVGVPDERKQQVLEKYGLQLVRVERDGALIVNINLSGQDAAETAAALQAEEGVGVAEPDLITPKQPMQFSLPHDDLLNQLWHLENTGSNNGQTVGFKRGADARIIAAWKVMDSLGLPEAIIGIVDDGFDLAHPDLAGKAVHAWDYVRNSTDVRPEPNSDVQRAGDWHGTCCAGVACGSIAKGQIVGAAPMSRIIPIRSSPDLIPDEIVKIFDHMTDKGAWVVSCSWGPTAANYPLGTRISSAIARCSREGRDGRGCVVVFAAGNDKRDVNGPNSLNGFAIHPDVIAISASTSQDERSDYSNFGAEIAVCAPTGGSGGWAVITSDVDGTYIDAGGRELPMGYEQGPYFHNFTGTSSSCPLVAGVCALVLSSNPSLTAEEVRRIVKATARQIGNPQDYGPDGHSIHFGFGCINAEKAVQEALRLRGPRLVIAATGDNLLDSF